MEFMHATDYPNGSLRVTADIPAGVPLPDAGVFASVEIHNDHPVSPRDSSVIDDASIPAMVTLVLPNGNVITIWPHGLVQVQPNEYSGGYLAYLTADGVQL